MSVEEGGDPRGVREFERSAAADRRPAAPVLGATTTPWVLDLIERFRAAGDSLMVCPHLVDEPDQGATWLASAPDLRSCRRAACTGAVAAALEERLGRPLRDEPTRCTTCGSVGVAVRGVGVAMGPTMLRGTVCDACLAARPIPTPAAAIDPDARPARRPMETGDEPIVADRETLAAAPDRLPFEQLGRRALRRGYLMAAACARATRPGLDPDQAVVGGLMVRAATLAGGLSAAPGGGSHPDDLAFRALVETTTSLWWFVRRASADDLADYRGSGAAPWTPEDHVARLGELGRRDDVATLLGPAHDAAPGSWRELTVRHLSRGPDGFALHLEPRGIDPLQALVAGEHLALACADYVDRMPTDLDPDDVRRLAGELTELRPDVEAAFAEAVADGRVAAPGDPSR